MNKFCIGTAQFGLKYGIANAKGQLGFREVSSILSFAKENGVTTLDTASAYGDSELILGQYGVSDWDVITKVYHIPENCSDINGWVLDSVSRSLSNLKTNQLFGILLHRPNELLNDKGEILYKSILRLKENKTIKKIGISIYNPNELESLIENFDFDIIQSPLSIVDRSLITSGWMDTLIKKKINIHIRSIFLQGLLLIPEEKLPDKFFKWMPLWNYWHNWLREVNLTPLQACLGFINQIPQIDRIIIGLDSCQQLKEILSMYQNYNISYPKELSSNDTGLINPAKWGNL